MSDFRKHLESSLEDPLFKNEWENNSVEREVMKQIVEARIAKGMTQQDLAKKCGMKASNLCRLENGNGNPSIATLNKIAQGLDMKHRISFE